MSEFDDISEEGLGLISSLLVRSPAKRMTAAQALAHPWLRDQEAGAGARGRVLRTDNLR